jgi:outer membrane protein insertion porin family
MGLNVGDELDQANLDRSLKNLYNTGLFADVKYDRNGSILTVNVQENPIINEISFEGNSRIKDDALLAEIQSRSRAVYTRTRVQSDTQRILDVYRRSGRYAAAVEPKIIKLDQNRVNLVFEVNEGPRTYVRAVNFIGNSKFSDGKLKEEISTRESRWYRFLSTADVYDPDRLEVDKELLRRYYLSRGYADFRVTSAVAELEPDGEGFFITFTVEEGERYKFGEIAINSVMKLDTNALKPSLSTVKNTWYNAKQVEDTVTALTKQLNDMQYAFVEVRPEVRRDREKRIIDLNYTIGEGERVYVERININGNMRTEDKVIRREMQISEGDPFNRSKISESEQNIRDLGFFERAEVEVKEGSAPDRSVVDVNVAEQSTGEISVGAGFSTNDGPLADFGISERNFLGKGQDLRFSTTLSGRAQEFNLSFTEPYFLDRDLSTGVDIFHDTRQNKESSYDQQDTGFALRMGYPLSEHLRQRWTYSLKNVKIDNVPLTASRYIRDQRGDRLTSMVGQELTYDRRDSRLTPTDGYVLRLGTDVAGVGGDAQFVRVKGGGAIYFPIGGPDWVVSALAEAGYMTGFGSEDVAINDRFFVGGDSMRGFKPAGIGPRDITAGTRRDALGGNRFARSSVELTFPLGLPEEFGLKGHLFTDAGTLWDSDSKPISGETFVDEASIRLSTGAGLSWRSPLGPIRVDLATPIIKKDYDEKQQFRFSFGTRF